MKKLSSVALLIMGAILVSQSANAQLVSDDLYMGFENQAGGGTEDYVINLGAASGIVGGSSVIDLSSDFSLTDFNDVLGLSSTMFGGMFGGSNGNPPNLYVTQLRVGGAGAPYVAGSTSPGNFYKGDILTGYSDISQLTLAPAAGTGILDTTKQWESYVEPTFANGSLYGDTGINPDSLVGSGTVLYEDLWSDSNNSISSSQPFTYLGYFTLDLTGENPSLTFTPEAVPEPGTAFIAGISGLSLLVLRRRFSKNV